MMEQPFYSRYNTGSANDGKSPALPYPVKPIRRPAVFLDCSPLVLALPYKTCTKCGGVKPLTAFHRNGMGGFSSSCKACKAAYHLSVKERHNSQMRAYSRTKRQSPEYRAAEAEANRIYHAEHKTQIAERKHRHYGANREHIAERKREYYAANAEHIREYYFENRARIAEYHRTYRTANHERITEHQREYRQTAAGKASMRAGDHNRRARKLAAGGTFTTADLASIRLAQTDKRGRLRCWWCGKQIKGTPHLDHWIPLKHGGANDAGNLHYMHAKCNLTKNAKHPTEIGRLL